MLSDFELRQLRDVLCPHDQARLDNAIVASREENALREMRDMRAIIESVAHIYRVTVKEILSKDRREHIVSARQLVAYVMRELGDGFSYPEIGRFLHRDHSTVIHACNRVAMRVASEPGFAARVGNLMRDLSAKEAA